MAEAPPTPAFLFFPDKAGLPCRWHATERGCRRGEDCDYAHEETSLTKFLQFLGSAQDTVDIAVFNLTLNEIRDCILGLKDKGVQIRIVTDREESESNGSDIQVLAEAGIPMLKNDGEGLMHHKFAVLDGKILMTGSFNWTRSAVLENNENVLVTSDEAAVEAYCAQFEQLWEECS